MTWKNFTFPLPSEKRYRGEGYIGIGKDFLDLENMLVLADDAGIFGSSMLDSTRAMVTETTRRVLVVIYCFESDLNLAALLDAGQQAFAQYAAAANIKTRIL